jgi:hypothetical protein
MSIRILALTGALLTIGLAGAEAKTLVSPPTYGGRSQSGSGFANCRVFNGGTTTVFPVNRQIITSSNNVLALTNDSCGSGVAPGGYCAFGGSGAGNLAFACKLDVSGTSANLVRAAMEVSNSSADVLNVLPAQ